MQTIDIDAPLVEPATARAIDEAMDQAAALEADRGHMGMSQIGGPCERLIWLKWRWSLPDTPSARIQRVFRVGNLLESAMAGWLRAIPGVELHTQANDGRQIHFQLFGGHFAGSLDGVVRGIPEAPKTWHVWECKTANTKRFAQLVKVGLKQWAPEYWSQAQCYMGSIGMDRALFTVINKDDCTIHTERLHYEPMAWDALQARAQRILMAAQPPEKTWPSPDYFEARMKLNADGSRVYFGQELPAPNCRNCRFSAPVLEGVGARWGCDRTGHQLSLEQQRAGCDDHQYITGLVPLPVIKQDGDAATYQRADGKRIGNAGQVKDDVFTSAELYQLARTGFADNAMAIVDSFDVAAWRTDMGGRVVRMTLTQQATEAPF